MSLRMPLLVEIADGSRQSPSRVSSEERVLAQEVTRTQRELQRVVVVVAVVEVVQVRS